MGHREEVRAYLEGLTLQGTVIDWGSGSKPVIRYVNGHKAMFHNIDNNPDVKPDTLADIQEPIKITEADHAFCMEVLEHTEKPSAALNNIYNNLKVGGKLHLSVPFLYPKHGDKDYWRFTDLGLTILAQGAGFKNIKVWDIDQGYIMEAIK